MKHDVSRRIQVIEQSVEDMGCLVSSRCDHLGVIPESGAFREPAGYRDAGVTMVASGFCGFGIT